MNNKLSDIDRTVKNLIDFDGLKFQESNCFDRYFTMHRRCGEAVHVINYEYYPKAGMKELTINGLFRYKIFYPRVTNIFLAVHRRGIYHNIQPIRADQPNLHDTDEIFLLRDTLLRDRNFPYFIDNNVYYEDRLMKMCEFHKHSIEEFALPFFDKFPTIQIVHDEIIEKKTNRELAKLIPAKPQLMKLVIQKLMNSSKYIEQREWTLNAAEMLMNRGDVRFGDVDEAKFYRALVEFLDSGEYLKITEDTVVEKRPTQESVPTVYAKLVHVLPPLLEEKFLTAQKKLAAIGIFFRDEFLLNDYRDNANWVSWKLDTLDGDKFLYHLLLFAGTRILHAGSGKYEPVSDQVYNFDSEWDGAVDYGEILTRLNGLTGNALPFENIEGRFDDFVGVTFTYKGESMMWEFSLDSDWTDYHIFARFLGLVRGDIKKDFYILIEGQGGLILYFDAIEKAKFEELLKGKELITLAEFVDVG